MTDLTVSNMSDFPGVEDEDLLYCTDCLGSTDPKYQTYNLGVSGFLLPVVGLVGLVGNLLVILVYTSRSQRTHSTSIYLAALAVSDFSLILTAMFLFCLEAWRHHNHPTIAWMYLMGAPSVFPIAAVFQTTSVYFCVAAGVDCFITVVLPPSVKALYCTARRAKITVAVMTVLCVLYNVPHAFELQRIDCVPANNYTIPQQICPTSFRTNPMYYEIYYNYMYTTFMAVGPLLLLVLLNACVVHTVCTKGATDDSDTISLILVVFFFIFCNSTALVVNFLETLLKDTDMAEILVYLVDLSNLLIVVNATANFFCYLCFGASFRATLKEILWDPKSKPQLIWKAAESASVHDCNGTLL